MAGQVDWKGRGAANKEFIVNPVLERNLWFEYRDRSAIGRLSKPVGKRTFVDGGRQQTIDVGASGAIISKEITSGDECRFTLVQKISGSPTFGDNPVQTGDYLSYLHEQVRVNKIDSPAIPLQEEMSRLRVKDILGGEDSEIRQQLSLWNAEEYTFEAYRAFFRGMSQSLSQPEASGGLAMDRGRGAGVFCSPEHIVIAGVQEITPATAYTSTALETYEDAISTALIAADALVAAETNDYDRQVAYGAKRSVIHDIREYISSIRLAGVMEGGREKWYCPCDPAFLSDLTRPGGELYEAWRYGRERSASNPMFDHTHIELDGLVFFRDPYLKQFRPINYKAADYPAGSGSYIKWGKDDTDLRDKTAIIPSTGVLSNWAPVLILGQGALLEATSGSLSVTVEEGKHGKGKEIATHVKQSFVRTRFMPKDGTTTPTLNQSSALMLFWTPNTLFQPVAP